MAVSGSSSGKLATAMALKQAAREGEEVDVEKDAEADEQIAATKAKLQDVKRALEAQFSEAWDLAGRPRDRDGCFAGWELVSGETPLGPHFCVGDYGLRRGDIVHAVVRRRG